MAILPDLPSLLDRIREVIFPNFQKKIKAKFHQPMLIDMAETLWNRPASVFVDTDHATLLNLVNTGGLTPGHIYRFDYEALETVLGTAITNREIPGYVQKVERLWAVATTSSLLDPKVLSESHPEDQLVYDVTINATINTLVQVGRITYREDPITRNKAPFDFRNTWVARENVDWASFNQPGPVTADRLDIVEQGFSAPGGIYINYFNGTVGATQPSVLTGQLWTSSNWDGNIITNGNVVAPDGATLPKNGTVVYALSLNNANCTNVVVNTSTTDVKIDQSSDIIIAPQNGGITVVRCKDVEVDVNCSGIHILDSHNIYMGAESSSILMYACYNNFYKRRCTSVFLSFNHDVDSKGELKNSVLRDVMRSQFGVRLNSVICNNLHASKMGNDLDFITAGFGRALEIKNDCDNIVSLGGDYNTFEEACSTINIDNRNGSGGVSLYQTYASISHSTFKKGCRNIVFDVTPFTSMFVTRCTFGENCENLTFDVPVTDTVFHRGIKNKDFRTASLARVHFVNTNDGPWIYDSGTPADTFLGTGFILPADDGATDQVVTNGGGGGDAVIQVESPGDPGVPTNQTTWQRLIAWDVYGQPKVMFMH